MGALCYWQSVTFWVTAESMGSLVEAAGKLQLGIFASGPLQEAALLQNAALQVSMSSNNKIEPVPNLVA
jgi:hypothetical protein